VDGAEGRHAVPAVFEPALNLAGPPVLMKLMRHTQQVGDVARGAPG